MHQYKTAESQRVFIFSDNIIGNSETFNFIKVLEKKNSILKSTDTSPFGFTQLQLSTRAGCP